MHVVIHTYECESVVHILGTFIIAPSFNGTTYLLLEKHLKLKNVMTASKNTKRIKFNLI